MAKQNKQDKNFGSMNFGNISKATENFEIKKPADNFMLNFKVDKNIHNEFRSLQFKLASEMTTDKFNPVNGKEFFQFLVYEIKNYLEESNKYKEAPNHFILQIYKRGRRPSGDRSFNSKTGITFSFGIYKDPEFRQIFNNVLYSYASSIDPDSQNFDQYSVAYFFVDIFSYLKNNLPTVIKSANKD